MGKSGSVTGKESPVPAPVIAPAPAKSHVAKPPGCHFGYKNRFPPKPNEHSHITPTAPPVYAPRVAPSQPPQQSDTPIADVPPVPAASPLSNVAYDHIHPPSKSDSYAGPPDVMPLVSPALPPSEHVKHFCCGNTVKLVHVKSSHRIKQRNGRNFVNGSNAKRAQVTSD
ncbi:uncharacterized protein Fot_35836 [Forsythia ovata]|uniref:Uncharacterized protein n=1 Tax=Forsythia ovata TaxID=205694 RepID=A0ABD1SNT3_9LAMI